MAEDRIRVEPGNVAERCVECGELIEGETRKEMIEKYTEHQVDEHHKKRAVGSTRE